MYRVLLADGHGMTEQRQDEETRHREDGPDEGAVAESAARILDKADRAVSEIRTEAEHAVEKLRRPTGAAAEPDRATEELRVEVAGLNSELESVRAELDPIKSGVIGLQSHSLYQTGVAALILAVLIAIAWKVVAG
jgi:hypothetical protein